MYQIIFYVPKPDLESVKAALFSVGAGKIGEYEQACWQTLGKGQFKPTEDANPSIGEANKLTFVEEYKVEILCPLQLIHQAIIALKKSHPYEEPAYAVFKLENL